MMCPRFIITVTPLVLLLAACSPAEEPSPSVVDLPDAAEGPIPGVPEFAELPVDGSVSGEITSVDAQFRTVVLEVDGAEWEFRYTENSDVIGAAGVQGLAAQTGSRATVAYSGTDPSSRQAVRIEILGPDADPLQP